MKFMVDVTTNSKMISPSKDDVMLYDGHRWYITTKQDLFREYEERINALIAQMNEDHARLLADNQAFKDSVSQQLVEMGRLIESLISAKGE